MEAEAADSGELAIVKGLQVPKDGHCFYNSFAVALGLSDTPQSLRLRVDRHLTSEELKLLDVISDESIQVRWADDVDINALVRSYDDVCLLIFDKATGTVNAFMNECGRWRTALLMREDHHYTPLLVDKGRLTRIRRTIGPQMGVAMDLSALDDDEGDPPMRRSFIRQFAVGFVGGVCVVTAGAAMHKISENLSSVS